MHRRHGRQVGDEKQIVEQLERLGLLGLDHLLDRLAVGLVLGGGGLLLVHLCVARLFGRRVDLVVLMLVVEKVRQRVRDPRHEHGCALRKALPAKSARQRCGPSPAGAGTYCSKLPIDDN